jgi:uncharacterized protein (DUF1015 family)
MSLIRPFRALRPAAGREQEVIAPPYDVLNTEEARRLARDRPWSFLHISKPEIDLAIGTDPYSPEVYAKAAANLQRMRREALLTQDPEPALYIYQMMMGAHVQTGLVVAASVAAYDAQRIRRHEFTRPDKEDDRVRQIEAVGAQTGPVLLAHPSLPGVESALAEWVGEAEPDADAVGVGGVRHCLWVIRDPEAIRMLTGQFEAVPTLYIADGHHRAAAASRVAAARRVANPRHSGEEPYNYFLAVVYPSHQMKILDYNRLVRDLNGQDESAFIQRVQESFSVAAVDNVFRPARTGEFGMYLNGAWHRLTVRDHLRPADPVARLDVSLLQDHLIAPILGITDPRRDQRIDFVGGIRGLQELETRVDSGEMAVGFAMYPTPMEDLMSVADARQVMPPKSTWFEPKLADGMASHLI